MKYYLLSFILLFFTIPMVGERVYWGIPLWAIISMLVSLLYAFILMYIIDKKWDELS